MDYLLDSARGWLLDVFGDSVSVVNIIAGASDRNIRRAIDKHYDGGWTGFVADNG